MGNTAEPRSSTTEKEGSERATDRDRPLPADQEHATQSESQNATPVLTYGVPQDEMAAAVERNDGQSAVNRAGSLPDFQSPELLFLKARAHLLTNDYASADTEFRRALLLERDLSNFIVLRLRFPAFQILSGFYLGQLYDRTGRRDQALSEYQEFLSHFDNSHTRLAQLGEARAALKRLMQ